MFDRHAFPRSFLILLLAALPSAASEVGNPYSQARFEISSDPTVMVLHVYLRTEPEGAFESLSLFGDGRLVVKEGRGKQVTAETSAALSDEERQALVHLAVGHGLAEWDGMDFHDRAVAMNGGKPLELPKDAESTSHLTVMLSLADYQHGAYDIQNHRRHLRFRNPHQVQQLYPGLPEIEGMMALVERLRRTLRAAEAPSNSPR